LICLQLIKRQFGMVGQVSQATGGASAQSTGTVCLDLARCIRDKLPLEKRDDYVELEDWLTDHDDETLAANRAQLRDYIGRGTFGNSEKEFVHCALLRLFTKKFANTCLSWAGVRGNKEFTLKTSKVWELLYDVINPKFPNFQKIWQCTSIIFIKMLQRRHVLAAVVSGSAMMVNVVVRNRNLLFRQMLKLRRSQVLSNRWMSNKEASYVTVCYAERTD